MQLCLWDLLFKERFFKRPESVEKVKVVTEITGTSMGCREGGAL